MENPTTGEDVLVLDGLVYTDQCTEESMAIHFYHSCPEPHEPLLPSSIASVVSSISTASRLSLRLAGLVVDNVFESLKYS